MTKFQIKQIFNSLFLGTITGVGVNFIVKGLDAKQRAAQELAAQKQAEQISQITKDVSDLKASQDKISASIDKLSEGTIIPESEINKAKEIYEEMLKQKGEELSKNSDSLIEFFNKYSNGSNGSSFNNSNNNFDFSSITENINLYFNELYKFLDQLTLVQEGAFLHMLLFSYVLFCIYIIVGIFFGNEIIKYFNLEEKYPKLGTILKYRAKFQNYYLAFNIICIILICVFGIALNVLIFLNKII